MNQKKIGKFIAEKRKNKKMTQQELADILGVTNRTVLNWETGKCLPDYSFLIPLCNNLDTTISELLTGEKEAKTNATVEMIIEYLDRNRTKNLKQRETVGNILLTGGTILSILSMIFLRPVPPFRMFPFHEIQSMYPIIGMLLAILGFTYITKKCTFKKRIILNSVFIISFLTIIITYDIIEIKYKNLMPRYQINHLYKDSIFYVETPFYDAYQCSGEEEYHIIPASIKYYKESEISDLNKKYCE